MVYSLPPLQGEGSTLPLTGNPSHAGLPKGHALRRLYLQLPNTHRRFSRADRRLASRLYQRGVAFELARSALLLATARRLLRDPYQPPLPPVRSLHYFLPVLEEIQNQPLPPGYVQYLESKIRSASTVSTPTGA